MPATTRRVADPPAVRPPRLVLASASPARRATLLAAGLEVEVMVSGVDEDELMARSGERRAEDVVLLLARAKAEQVAQRIMGPADGGDVMVLGCDSMLELDGLMHGKPADADEARARWRRMSGASGVLHTGHWLVAARPGGHSVGAVSSTTVHFAELDPAEIDAYVATGEPLEVAGAFTVDGLGAAFVRGVEGDHHGVVGVSVPLLRDLVRDLHVAWPDLWADRSRRRGSRLNPATGSQDTA